MNRLSTLSLLCLFLALAVSTKAQYCGTDIINRNLLEGNPEAFRKREAKFLQFMEENGFAISNVAQKVVVEGTDSIYEVPVVFHIIHTGSAVGTNYNPTDAKIIQVLDYLNKSFAATWPGYAAVGSGGVNIPIRFVLAKRTPSCQATTGITRYNGSTLLGSTYTNSGVRAITSNGVTETQLKEVVQWDPSSYYNIWVVNKIDGWDGYVPGNGVVGYARFPGGEQALDGTVIMESFNDVGETTLPHELGHAFNLYHTFQDGCATGDCSVTGDRVCDTDPHAQVSGCPSTNNCQGISMAIVSKNIMNYTDCTDRFTQGQKARVMAAVKYYRGSLLESLGATLPSTQPTNPSIIPVAATCATPTISFLNNDYDIGPSTIKIGNVTCYSGSYTSDGYQAYIDRTLNTCLRDHFAPINLTKGATVPISIKTGQFNSEHTRVWIDYNNNGNFELNEMVVNNAGTVADGLLQTTFTIPNTAAVVSGVNIRMRVRSDFVGAVPSACGLGSYGQAEDFALYLSNPLPAYSLNFNAYFLTQRQAVVINWHSDRELGLSTYVLEASRNFGQSFGSVYSAPAAGSGHKYQFEDRAAAKTETNLYRLKMIDEDGSVSYSNTIVAKRVSNTLEAIQVFPNPTSGQVNTVFMEQGNYSLKMYNALGVKVWEQVTNTKAQNTATTFYINQLNSGVYYLQVNGPNGLQKTMKLLKQ